MVDWLLMSSFLTVQIASELRTNVFARQSLRAAQKRRVLWRPFQQKLNHIAALMSTRRGV
jgi:hypothetical protein